MTDKKHVVIIGAGTAGVMVANMLSKKDGMMVTVIYPAEFHYYQPGFLLYPFNRHSFDEIHRPTASLLSRKVRFMQQAVIDIAP